MSARLVELSAAGVKVTTADAGNPAPARALLIAVLNAAAVCAFDDVNWLKNRDASCTKLKMSASLTLIRGILTLRASMFAHLPISWRIDCTPASAVFRSKLV